MAAAQGPLLAAVLLLVSSGLHCSSPLPACPESCTCQRAPLLNCSSSGLSLVPQRIQDSVSELDLTHNLLDSVTLDRPHHNLRNVWLGNNSITHLSLCIERNLGSHFVRGRHLRRLRPWSKRGCVSWAPTLQLLSVERNQLGQLPEGLEGSELLQVLQLSFNRIASLQPGDLSHLRQLKELNLQHNLITSLHPQMFQDLAQLRVLDLSFNMLTSLHPSMYLSLRNIGADVRLGGNRWQCDCSMRSLRRRMAYDISRGLQAWNVVCASPSILSGRDLLQLEEDDLNCSSTENRPEFHRDVTVYSGSEILLSCSTQDSTWWTPSGPASVSQPQAGLLISDITERDAGLYVCVSEDHEVVSVFNLQISKIEGARRKARSLPGIIPQGTPNRIGQERNQRATQSDLTLAVCLSVFITFLIAFILGVLARPCIDVLWRRVTNKKSSSATHSVSTVEQRQYDNEAYSSVDEPQETGTHRERRVTFSTIEVREDSNVQYYDTVASGDQESINNDAVIECEADEAEQDTHTAGDSGSENSLRQSSPEDNQKEGRDLSDVSDAGRTHNIEFEHIPDPVEVEKGRSLSSSSDSSLSDKVFNEHQMTQGDHTRPKSPQLAEDSVQQRADFSTARKVEVPQMSVEGSSEIPGFSSEPFADWSPHTNNINLTDPGLWQENEEQFEFSDSVRSTSARSSSAFGSVNDSKLIVALTSDKQKRIDTSSSSSYVSEDEPTKYTVNSDQEEEEEEDIQRNKPGVTNSSFEQQIHSLDLTRPSVGFNQGDYRHVKPMPRTKGRIPRLSASSSSSSESESEITNLKVEHNTGIVKAGIEINAPVPTSDSSSSDESTDETTKHSKKQEQGEVVMAGLPVKEYQSVSHNVMKPQGPALDLGHVTPIKRRLDIRAPSPPTDSSSSSDSEDETTSHTKKKSPGKVDIAGLPFQESQNLSHDQETRWPALDLEQTTRIKKHLDIKTPSSPSNSSSSSDSEDETTHHIKKQEKGETHMARLPNKVSQTVSYDPQTQWPALDLERNMRIKRRLDIKKPSTGSDSSSSSDSEDETSGHKERQRPGEVDIAELPFQESQAESHDPETGWPALELEHTTRIKRRLDIKAPSPASDSSSSSDSEDETTNHIKKQGQGKTDMARLPITISQNVSHDKETRWPALNLDHTTRIKRRLDIKAPSPASDSSSSSDSEDETITHTKKERPGVVGVAELPFQNSQTISRDPDTRWPALDLQHIPRIKRRLDIKVPSPPPDSSSKSKRVEDKIAQIKKHEQGGERLDIKAPSPASDSSSSSDSEDETTNHIKKQGQGKTDTARLPITISQNVSHDKETRWPALDLERTTRIKRRLDIKAPSPASDSSSSSDSEDETIPHTKKERPGVVGVAELPFRNSQTISRDPDTRWPALDLQHIPRIKRHLDIKAPSPPPDSSSKSERMEDKLAQIKKHEQGGERLDIKAPSPASDSSSSSDSEDETTNHIKKQGQGKTDMVRLPVTISQNVSHDKETRWPALDLERTTRIKRRLDIKAPSPASDSSSSSDSEDETIPHTKKERPGVVGVAELPFQNSQTISRDPDTRWPALDLQHIPRIKRHLDIKAPSPPPDSSSKSERMEDKLAQIKKHEQGGERLDIKATSPASDSSSSSDSEDETTNHIKKQGQGKTDMVRLPITISQNVSHNKETRWPALDLERTTRIKRRLDIKAPSPDSDSSSSSDSEDETIPHTKKERPGMVGVAELPFQNSQTISRDPDTRWPALDLQHIPRIKRHLDIKAPSPPPDSSSKSKRVEDKLAQIKKHEQGGEHLDIKAPSPASDSSSSSDSEDETTNQIQKQGQGKTDMVRFPVTISQNVSHNKETQWPALDLERTTRIKRRLDIKAPSPASDSSSSSDSEDETIPHTKKERPGMVGVAELPFQNSQTVRHDPDTRWPALELEHIPRIKRRLDIKAPSPPPDSSSKSKRVEDKLAQIKKHEQGGEHLDIKATSSDSDSSSSSDSEDETTNHIKKQGQGKTDMARLPVTISQTVSHDQETRWPALDLEHTTRIKRHLDIKGPSPASDSSSSSDSEDETKHHTKKERPGVVGIAGLPFQESQTISHDLEKRWPAVDLGNITHIKRRLDIKAPSPPPDSLLSRGSTNRTVEGKRGKAVTMSPRYSSSSSDEQEKGAKVEPDPDSRWPELGLSSAPHVKRRLDIKARSPLPESSSSSSSNSDNESRLSSHTVKHERDKGDVGITSHEQQTKLHKRSLGVPYINRRLDIKAPSPQPDPILSSVSPGSPQSESSSSRSDSEDENRDHTKLGLRVSAISKAKEKEFSRSPKTPGMNISRSPKTDHNIKLEKYTVITDDVGAKTTSDNISTTLEINPELESRWTTMNLGISRFRKRLEITSRQHQPPNLPSSAPPDSLSSFSSETGTGYESSRTRQKRREVGMQGIIHKEKSLTPENKPVNVSLSLKGQDDNSGNSIEAKERLRKYYSLPTTEEKSNPDTMLTGLGTPNFRRYLDITVSEKASAAPLRQLSDSSSSIENEDASTEHEGKGRRGRYQLPVVADKEASQIEEVQKKAGVELKSQTKPLPESSNSSSSSSESENEVTGYTAKQSRHASNMTGMTDSNSPVTYKRVIIKASFPPSNSFLPSGQTIDHLNQRQKGAETVTVVDGQEGPPHRVGDRNASLAPRRVTSMSFDDLVKKRIEQSRHTTDVDLPPEIRWTGIGRHLSDLSSSSPRRHLDVGLSSPQQAPPAEPELPPPGSSNSLNSKSGDGIKQDRGKADVTLMHKYSSLSPKSVSLASSRAPEKFDSSSGSTNEILRAVSEDRTERKGLSALKAMSSERRMWDKQNENVDKGASSLLDDHGPQVDTRFNYRRSEEDIKPLAKQTLTRLPLSSISVDKRSTIDLLYGVPHYRSHNIGGISPPQEAAPPIPATPPPDETEGLTWRSPQSSKKQGLEGTRPYLQQSRNTEESDPSSLTPQNLAIHFDSSNINISHV